MQRGHITAHAETTQATLTRITQYHIITKKHPNHITLNQMKQFPEQSIRTDFEPER